MSEHIHQYGPLYQRVLPEQHKMVWECRCQICDHIQTVGFTQLSPPAPSLLQTPQSSAKRKRRKCHFIVGLSLSCIFLLLSIFLYPLFFQKKLNQINTYSIISSSSVASNSVSGLTSSSEYITQSSTISTSTQAASTSYTVVATTIMTTSQETLPLATKESPEIEPTPEAFTVEVDINSETKIYESIVPSTEITSIILSTTHIPSSTSTTVPNTSTTIVTSDYVPMEIPSSTAQPITEYEVICTTMANIWPAGSIISGDEVLAYLQQGNAASVKINENTTYSYDGHEKESIIALWPLTDSFICSYQDDILILEKF